MNLQAFGKQLQAMRKQAGLSQERLAEALDQAARVGPPDDYRVIDGTLVSRWERAKASDSRVWKPTRAYVLHLIRLFADQLNEQAAQDWANQVGYRMGLDDLQGVFASSTTSTPAPARLFVPPKPPRELPHPLTSFVGREREINELIDSLAQPAARLITITGEGGTGKTRLALAAAQAASDAVLPADGVYFVPLVGIEAATAGHADDRQHSPNPVVLAIARCLSMTFSNAANEPTAQLIQLLQSKAQLLILDNCEHLINEMAFITDLLEQAPHMRVWATSRVPLNNRAERVMLLSGLPLPTPIASVETTRADFDADLGKDSQNLTQVPSVQLFIERARQRNIKGLFLDARTLTDVATLCRMVNGSPLALELAANWFGPISITEMVGMLRQHDLSLLESDQRDLPMRHRSMMAVFETSWQMLPANGQRILARLAVFHGAFSREAAAAIAGATLSDLALLVNQSLLNPTTRSSGITYYAMHELLSQFAAIKLEQFEAELPNEARSKQRHADYFLRRLAQRHTDFYRADSHARAAMDEIDAALDNILVAWQWAIIHQAVALLAEAWLALRDFYHVRGLYHQAEAMFADAAAQLRRNPTTRRLGEDLQTAQAFFLNQLNRYEQSISVVQALPMNAEPTSLTALRAQLEWGAALSLQGKHDEAIHKLGRVAERAGALGANLVQARALHAMYRNWLMKGDLDQAEQVLQQTARLYHEADYALAEGFVSDALGHVARRRGQLAKARTCYEEALHIYERASDSSRAMWSQSYLAGIAAARGEFGRAYRLHMAAYAKRDISQDQRAVVNTRVRLARLLGQLGAYAEALHDAGEAVAQFRQMNYVTGEIEALCTLGRLQRLTGEAQLASANFQNAMRLAQISNTQSGQVSALLGMGETLLDLRQYDEAQTALQQALALQRQAQQLRSTPPTLSALARVAMAQQRIAEAVGYVDETLAIVNAPEYEYLGELPPILWACYDLLSKLNDSRAAGLLRTAQSLVQAQAADIDDEALRDCFLTQVAVNRAIAGDRASEG